MQKYVELQWNLRLSTMFYGYLSKEIKTTTKIINYFVVRKEKTSTKSKMTAPLWVTRWWHISAWQEANVDLHVRGGNLNKW